MAGQSLGYAGLTGGLPFHARTNLNDHNGLPCFAAPLPVYGDRHRRPRDVSAAISGSAAPKTTVLKQQIPPPVFQAEDSALSDAVPEEPKDAAASEDSVICTFRWPAALPGQEVSVVGACDPSCLILNSLSTRNLPLILRAWAHTGPCHVVLLSCRILHRLAKSHCSTKKLRQQRLYTHGRLATWHLSGRGSPLCSQSTARAA